MKLALLLDVNGAVRQPRPVLSSRSSKPEPEPGKGHRPTLWRRLPSILAQGWDRFGAILALILVLLSVAGASR